MAELDPRLQNDTVAIGTLPLSHVLLMRDANYPWCLLVPDRDNITEIFQLSQQDQQQLMLESSLLASVMQQLFAGDKINIAALGNIIPQLHLHHVVRYKTDPAWPAPVWGACPAAAYSETDLQQRVQQLQQALLKTDGFVVHGS